MRRHQRRPEHPINRRPASQSWFRRHRYPILIALILTLIVFRVGFDDFLQTSWAERCYAKIEYGMTAQQVEGILGKADVDDDTQKIWSGPGGIIILGFKDGLVSAKELVPLKLPRGPRRHV